MPTSSTGYLLRGWMKATVTLLGLSYNLLFYTGRGVAVHDGLAVREAPLALVKHPHVVVGAVALQDRSARRVERQERSVGPAADPAVAGRLRHHAADLVDHRP